MECSISPTILTPFGKRLQFAIEHGPVEIVDLPIKNGDCPQFFVCLPEGNFGLW